MRHGVGSVRVCFPAPGPAASRRAFTEPVHAPSSTARPPFLAASRLVIGSPASSRSARLSSLEARRERD